MNITAIRQALSAAVLATLLASCGGTGDASKDRERSSGPPRPVGLARAEMLPMERSIAATGTLAAQEQSTLSAKVPGRLQRLAVDIGSVVREGDLLAQVEPRDYELRLQQAGAALAQARVALGLPLEGEDDRIPLDEVSSVKQAQAVLDEAAKNRERIENLSQVGIASQAELDTVRASYTVARARHEVALEEARTRLAALAQRRAEYEIASKQLADASVRAPFDGAVQARPANLGEYVAAGVPIITLVKSNPLRLRLEVPERDSLMVRLGQLVRLRVEGDTNVYPGTIARLSPALTEQNRMLLVEADVPNPGSLRPGLFASANVVVDEHEEVLTVPTNAVVTFAGIEKVVVIQDGKALEKDVNTGRRRGDRVEILSGLALGESVVLDPAGLRTGQPVVAAEVPTVTSATEVAPATAQSTGAR